MIVVSVVIPTKDRPEYVVDAVLSVFACTYQGFEVFVIDQSAGDATESALHAYTRDSRLHYVRNPFASSGCASSRNIGIALSSGDIVAIIDDDVTVHPNWMANLVAEYTANPELELVFGKLTAPPAEDESGFVPTFDPDNPLLPLNSWTVCIVTAGANYSMRRQIFERLGGYDEAFGPGSKITAADDGVMAMRIVRSGAKWKACSAIAVEHTHGRRSTDNTASLLKGYQRGTGGMFGRVTRRGDIGAAMWFLRWQFSELVTVVVPNLLHGRRPTHLGWIRDRSVGFWHGFTLPPQEGFVGPSDLQLMRSRIQALKSVQTTASL